MKPQILKKVNLLLESARLRRTEPRIRVLAALVSAKKPMAQDEIAESIVTKTPNKVTIYRCLEKFVETGLVHKAFLQDRTQHYELSSNCTARQCHPHFTCTQCGKTQCLIGINVPMLKTRRSGFIVHRQQVRLEGLCPNCA